MADDVTAPPPEQSASEDSAAAGTASTETTDSKAAAVEAATPAQAAKPAKDKTSEKAAAPAEEATPAETAEQADSPAEAAKATPAAKDAPAAASTAAEDVSDSTDTPTAATTAAAGKAAPADPDVVTLAPAAVTTAASGDSVDAGETQPRRFRIGLVPAVAALTGLLFILGVTSGVFFYMKYNDLRQTVDARNEARQQVCDYAKSLVTYDYNNLDPYFKSVLDGATGDFKSLFSGQSKYLKSDLVQGQVKSAPSKIECGVKSGDASHAEIVLSIGQIGSSVATKGQPQPAQISMVATAQKVDGRWLVSNLQTPSQVIP